MWLNLPTIRQLVETTRPFFPVVEYAFATVPTYPSGQIGFLVASKEAGDDLKTPLRAVSDTRYDDAEVHRAAFVLPRFCKVMLQEGRDIRPELAKTAQLVSSTKRGPQPFFGFLDSLEDETDKSALTEADASPAKAAATSPPREVNAVPAQERLPLKAAALAQRRSLAGCL